MKIDDKNDKTPDKAPLRRVLSFLSSNQ